MNKLLVVISFLALLAVGYSCQYQLNSNGSVCAIVNANISLTYSYIDEDFQNVTRYHNITCPGGNATVQSCTDDVTMSFPLEQGLITITFEFKEDDSKWNMSRLSLTIEEDSELFPNDTLSGKIGAIVSGDIFESRVNSEMSYMCNANRTFYMTNNVTNVTMHMHLAMLRVQAFTFSEPGQFGNAYRCNNDVKGSKIVPIAVGAALAGLVIIVLIAYIIGRLRSRRQSSYEALS